MRLDRAVKPLISIVQEPYNTKSERKVKSVAIMALVHMRATEAIPVLINLIRDTKVDLAVEAARAIAEINNPTAIEPLEEALTTARTYYIRDAINEALKKLKSSK